MRDNFLRPRQAEVVLLKSTGETQYCTLTDLTYIYKDGVRKTKKYFMDKSDPYTAQMVPTWGMCDINDEIHKMESIFTVSHNTIVDGITKSVIITLDENKFTTLMAEYAKSSGHK